MQSKNIIYYKQNFSNKKIYLLLCKKENTSEITTAGVRDFIALP